MRKLKKVTLGNIQKRPEFRCMVYIEPRGSENAIEHKCRRRTPDLTCHQLSVRHRTHNSQHLPDVMADKMTRFQSYIIKLRQEHEYPLSRIRNADQTPPYLQHSERDLHHSEGGAQCDDKHCRSREGPIHHHARLHHRRWKASPVFML